MKTPHITVSSWSNVRMSARLTQSSFEPGSKLLLDVALTEYGLPVEGRARVDMDVQRPDGVMLKLSLPEAAPGTFGTDLVASLEGVWRLHVRARGRTYGGSAFTREQLLSAAVIVGGDKSPPQSPAREGALECLLRCLAGEPGWQKWLKEHGADGGRLRECLEGCGRPDDPKELDQLG